MKEIFRYGFILAVICMTASGLLAGVNSLTKSKIALQAQNEEDAALKAVFPQAARFQRIGEDPEESFYKAYDKQDRFSGVVFKASAKGYSGAIVTMVAMLKDGTISAIKVLSQNETPGLGAKISESGFSSQFTGCKDLSAVQAITGATISSSAVIESVKMKSAEIKKAIENER